VLVDPEQREVFPLDFEPILRQDGAEKNDCEQNAAKRLCKALAERYANLPIIFVNYLLYEQTDKRGRVTRWTWITNLPLGKSQVEKVMGAGRGRWKIENETFNTLKNQGYHFEHNYGHGERHLATVMEEGGRTRGAKIAPAGEKGENPGRTERWTSNTGASVQIV
jgi:hypothetical protein